VLTTCGLLAAKTGKGISDMTNNLITLDDEVLPKSLDEIELDDLGRHIKAFIDKAEFALKKTDEYLTSASRGLVAAQQRVKKSGGIFAEWLKEHDIGRSYAYDLIAVGNGSKTLADLRQATAQRNIKYRKKKASESVTVTDTPIPPATPVTAGAEDEAQEPEIHAATRGLGLSQTRAQEAKIAPERGVLHLPGKPTLVEIAAPEVEAVEESVPPPPDDDDDDEVVLSNDELPPYVKCRLAAAFNKGYSAGFLAGVASVTPPETETDEHQGAENPPVPEPVKKSQHNSHVKAHRFVQKGFELLRTHKTNFAGVVSRAQKLGLDYHSLEQYFGEKVSERRARERQKWEQEHPDPEPVKEPAPVSEKKWKHLRPQFFKGKPEGQLRAVWKTRETKPEKIAEYREALALGCFPQNPCLRALSR